MSKGRPFILSFGFKPGITLETVRRVRSRNEASSVYHKLDTIVIDEISMVRADLLDCVDRFLRLNGPDPEAPFGGIQMIFIGDLYQLPPVVTSSERDAFRSLYETPYFYSARSFDPLDMEFIELEKVYRQHDQDFHRPAQCHPQQLHHRGRSATAQPAVPARLSSRHVAKCTST